MEKKEILALVKELNGLKDNDDIFLVTKKVKVVGISNEDLVISFLEACESVNEEKEDLIPENIVEAYNELVKEDPRTKKEPEEKKKEEKVSSKKKEAPVSKKTETKEKTKSTPAVKEKKETEANKSRDEYGHTEGSMAAKINLMLKKGSTKEEMVKELMEKHDRDEVHALGKIAAHIKYLEKNFSVTINVAPKTQKMSIAKKETK